MPLTAGLLDTTVRSPQLLLNWRARDLTLNALTGQAGVFSRSATSTSTDFGGFALNVGYGQPVWRGLDLDLNGVRESIGLTLGNTGETLSWQLGQGIDPRALSFYLQFVFRDVSQVSGRIFQMGSGSNTNPRLLLYLAGAGQLSWRHDESATSVQTASVTVVNGNTMEVRCVMNADGSVFMGYSTTAPPGSGTETLTATTAALAASGWSGSTIWVGSINTGNECPLDLVAFKAMSGVQSMQALRDAF